MEMVNMKKMAVVALTIWSLLAAAPAAANYTCSGPVRGVSLSTPEGLLLAESIGSVSWPVFCSFRETANGIPPDDCKRLHVTLLTAQTTGRTVTFWVNDPGTVCPALTPWAFVKNLYFLKLDG